VVSGGNLLANDRVPQAIVEGFLASTGHLGDHLVAAVMAVMGASLVGLQSSSLTIPATD
jgi:hypothetical protein